MLNCVPTCNNIEVAQCTNGSIRLVDGASSSEGRVELCSNGVWTTIGDSGWDYNDARVACRQLEYNDQCENKSFWQSGNYHTRPCLIVFVTGAVAITGSYFASGHSRIYYFSVHCSGDEQKLIDCPLSMYSTNDQLNYWYNDKRAGVACETQRLAGNLSTAAKVLKTNAITMIIFYIILGVYIF